MDSHPFLQALRAAHAALDTVSVRDDSGQPTGWASLEGMDVVELGEAVRLQSLLEGRVSALRLHAVAAAEASNAAEVVAAADTSAWAASAGRNRARSWGGLWLAQLLESKYRHTGAALARGRISEEHAAVIVRAGEKVPDGVSAAQLADCEERLVDKATRMPPDRLRRAARRLLEPLSAQLADAHEDELLREQEHKAEFFSSLMLCDNGDGTWTGKFDIPELHGHLLKTALERLSSPRRYTRTKTGEPVDDDSVHGGGKGYYAEMGAAFCEILEHLPEAGHGRSGFTLVVHVDEEKLRAGVGAATLETGASLSNEEVRRLLCEAAVMPMVMGGRSVPLDLGRASRLFTKAQAIALSAIHDTCAAEGCDRPFAWCEIHHRESWADLGRTDLDNAAPLCGYHHRRIHDVRYEHEWLANGSVRIRHRWRSRWENGMDPWAKADAERAARESASAAPAAIAV